MSRDKYTRAEQLEGELIVMKLFARRLWQTLATRAGPAMLATFESGLAEHHQRVVDVAYDAAETVWERHKILVEPCRRVFGYDVAGVQTGGGFPGYPDQGEMYLAKYPGGDERTVTRAQLLMMAGFDPEERAEA